VTVVSADAPGKLFLTGEYAVLDGAPAVVAAVDRRVAVQCRTTPDGDGLVVESLAEGRRWTANVGERTPLPDGDAGAVLAALRVVRARGSAAGHIAAVVDSRAFLLGGRKLGLGRSAATVVAAVAALGAAEVFALARQAHAALQDGRGSGADVAASFHGGLVEVRRRGEDIAVSARTLPAGVHLVVGYTGEAAPTGPMLRRFEVARAPRALHDLHAAAERAADAVARADAKALLQAVDASGELLAALGREAGIPIVTPALARLVALARRAGAAAKPSGAGGGDCGIALARSPAEAAAVRAAWAGEGLVPLALSIAAEGVRQVPAGDAMDEAARG
jgi:phosphomevalonate kinase